MTKSKSPPKIRKFVIFFIISAIIGSAFIIMGLVHPDNLDYTSSTLDLKNWATLSVEVGVAIYISLIVYYVSDKQQDKMAGLIERIDANVDAQEKHNALKERITIRPMKTFLQVSKGYIDNIIQLNSVTQTTVTQQAIAMELRKLKSASDQLSLLPELSNIRDESIIDDYQKVSLDIALLCLGMTQLSHQNISDKIDSLLNKLP